jgi:hypothetical protein
LDDWLHAKKLTKNNPPNKYKDGEKHQPPTSKLQRNFKPQAAVQPRQLPKQQVMNLDSILGCRKQSFVISDWMFSGAWSLDVGA